MNDRRNMKQLAQNYKDKKVFVTGHTGFKGTWLTKILQQFGADVVGYSLDPYASGLHPTQVSGRRGISDLRGDIRDFESLSSAINDAQPDFVFHLAAQAIVSKSYESPVETFSTNVLGTVHVLEAIRRLEKPCSTVIITSDKVYRNNEWLWGYKETDQLGGHDPYSASKAAAEIAISTYTDALIDRSIARVAIGRAGNVVGGGDWSKDRIVPDCARSWRNRVPVVLRSWNSVRPWQHVLEPLRGYLTLGAELVDRAELHGEAFNFGPLPIDCRTVGELVDQLSLIWPEFSHVKEKASSIGHEAQLLKLNCEKSQTLLGWEPRLNFEATVKMTADWHVIHRNSGDVDDPTYDQIGQYFELFG